ncbi:MAG: [FeFe] hydrogenase H-cluster radical SAM maturase HydE [Cyanobacteria bacterium SIG30]|nr:[FeFe] hydrogenase H-cluster radical SAM maturase HydE [Cyanobacteria bacterium SIG30]
MFTKNEIIEILSDNSKNEWLFGLSDSIRKDNVGDGVHLRALIEFSNYCKNNCLYCGLRCLNKNVKRYRMPKSEIIETAKKAVDAGYKTIVLQSGEDIKYKINELCEIVSEIKKYNVAVTLSIGEYSFDEYKMLKDAGADRFLLRIETSNKLLYEKMHPNMSFEKRIECLKNLSELNFEVGSGCIVGLPFQTIESLASDILFFKEINADMIGIGPLIIHNNTPLSDYQNGDFILALKVMAITRILMPKINIPATTAMETLLKNGQEMALKAGANVLMVNVTDQIYSDNYSIYPNKIKSNSNIIEQKALIEQKLKSIGRFNSNDFGFRAR